MHPRIPSQPEQEPAMSGADDVRGLDGELAAVTDGELAAVVEDEFAAVVEDEFAAVVDGARRRAVRDGDRQIDTAHLLHSLLEHDAEVRAAFGDGARIARLLGYLVQRSIGYGLRWQGAVEGSAPGSPAVTQAAHGTGGQPGECLSPVAAVAMDHARTRAVRRGAAGTRGLDLLAALVADPRARAVEVLGRAGVDARDLLEGVRAASGAGAAVECATGGDLAR
ncbi:Clp protease N-terminal domain-containing protein [Streptomyces longwoodensis]|uniref:Clp protease N-terminal domain-containing protein n=1 Tax=Streptomyces longwoodensis TaxID=68231 RepID=UPI0037FA8033